MPALPFQTDPPLSPAMLDQLVLRWRRDAPAAGVGAHLRRRQGHSLEFREYRHWQRGDDIRAVDWRISARQPRDEDLLLRSFEAEDQLALAIVIDNRPDMALPETMPRLLYALWAARALTALALSKGDQVVLARLFDGPGDAVLSLRGGSAENKARRWAETLWHDRSQAKPRFADPRRILDKLRPAGAVVVISDMLFEDPEGLFLRFARRAQEKRRSLSVLQLDSIGHEIALLRAAVRFNLLRADRPDSDAVDEFDEAAFRTATDAVTDHLARLRRSIHGGGLDWPGTPVSWPEPGSVEGAPTSDLLKTLFIRSFPRLGLLSGLSLGGAA